MSSIKKLSVPNDGAKYLAIIESMEASLEPEPYSTDEKKEIRRLVKDENHTQEEAEEKVLDAREPASEDDEGAEYVAKAILRHRSYLPFVEAGSMTIYEAVREVGANRSADGRGQERT